MADKPEQKSNINNLIIKMLNKAFLGLNLIALLFVIYQAYDFFSVYSKKNDELFQQGRILMIGTKDNKIELADLTDKEIELKKLEYRNKSTGSDTDKKPDDFIGPLQNPDETKAPSDDLIGPMPASEEEKAATENKPLEPAKPVDYKTANLSIIITEIGLKKDGLDAARTLPKEVSFAFSPYSDELQKKIDFAIRDGREVMLNLMMNPSNYPVKDAGPLSIQVNYDETQNLARFSLAVNVAKNYSGLLANNDEIITSRFDKISSLFKKITEKNVFFGFFRTTNNANLENDAKPFATDIFSVDYLIDEDPSENVMINKLNIAKEDLVIKKKRLVIAIKPNPVSIRVLKKWLDENLGDNIQLAPISYFVKNN